jgi:hypothetical protein
MKEEDKIEKTGEGKHTYVRLFDGEKFYSIHVVKQTFSLITLTIIKKLLSMDFDKNDGVTNYTLMCDGNVVHLPFDKEKLIKLNTEYERKTLLSESYYDEPKLSGKSSAKNHDIHLHNPILDKKLSIVTQLLDSDYMKPFFDQIENVSYDLSKDAKFVIPTDRDKMEDIWFNLLLEKNDLKSSIIKVEDYEASSALLEKVKDHKPTYEFKTNKEKCNTVRNTFSMFGELFGVSIPRQDNRDSAHQG